MTIKGILFDLYGTLVDIETDESKDEIYRTIAHYLTYQGVYLHRRRGSGALLPDHATAAGSERRGIYGNRRGSDMERVAHAGRDQVRAHSRTIGKSPSPGLPCRIAQPAATIPGRKRGVEHVKDQLRAGIGNGCPILLRHSRNPRRRAGWLLQACHHLKPLWLQKT